MRLHCQEWQRRQQPVEKCLSGYEPYGIVGGEASEKDGVERPAQGCEQGKTVAQRVHLESAETSVENHACHAGKGYYRAQYGSPVMRSPL